jgi:protein-disulfide isomerase
MVAGTKITQSELQARSASRENTESESYATQLARLKLAHERALQMIREQELARLVDERLLAHAAAAQNVTTDALLARIEHPQPSKAEVYSFYEERREKISAPFEVVSDAIRERLANDAYAQKVREFYDGLHHQYPNQAHLDPRHDVVPGRGPSRGNAESPVTIVEFADFQCPYCIRVEPTLRRLLEERSSDVRLEFRQLPLPSLHPEAQRAAEAAVCADEQHLFWEYHDAVFAAAGNFNGGNLIEIGKQVGVDTKAFHDCLTSGRAADTVRADTRAADDLVVSGTPALFVNGRFVPGTPSYETLLAVVEDELRRARPVHDGGT